MGENSIFSRPNFLEPVQVELPDEAGDPAVPEVPGKNFLFKYFLIPNLYAGLIFVPSDYIKVLRVLH